MATIPTENDILFGRGGAVIFHPGNQRFRAMVSAQRRRFAEERVRKKKRAIATGIMDAIHGLRPPGRFLTEAPGGGTPSPPPPADASGGSDGSSEGGVHPVILGKAWVRVEPDKALAKIMHRLREKEKDENGGPAAPASSRGRGRSKSLPRTTSSSDGKMKHRPSVTESVDTSLASSSFASRPDSAAPPRANGSVNILPLVASGPSAGEVGITGSLGGQVASEAPEVKLGGGDVLDEKVDEFLRDFSAQHDENENGTHVKQGSRETTLREWIEKSRRGRNASEYIRWALPIALKLTECLIDEGDSLPPTRIAAENVCVRADGSVSICMRSAPHVSSGGGGGSAHATSRLFALGVLLYELFSGDRHLPDFGATPTSLTMNSIDLNDGPNDDHRPSKRSQRQSTSLGGSKIAQCTSRLKSTGAPSSICSLVGNLLDCSNGEFSGDDCYRSFADLQADLQLMERDPSRFLEDIDARPLSMSIGDKIYGREGEIAALERSFRRQDRGECFGIVIKGGAGVGKSKLATHVRDLTNQSNGYVSMAKFDQNTDATPLSTIGSSFNELCDLFVRDTDPAQLRTVEESLVSGLANQAGLLAGVVPSLKKLMPLAVMDETSGGCVDSAASMRYMFGKLLLTLASNSRRPISVCIDDVQWADSASLLLISCLMRSAARCPSVFFTLSYRDDEVGGPFDAWLRSISVFPLKVMTLEGISIAGVTSMLSDSLHLSPRLTRPLASVLHHKTRGNPLFLRQLIESLTEQGLIYIDWSHPRWSWDLTKIMDLELNSDVLALLVKEMQGLPTDLQFGLKVASCWGSSVKYSIVDILSEELKVDLANILRQVCKRSFMTDISDSAMFRFSHDKIEQAAYGLLEDHQRRKYHVRFGLALFSHKLKSDSDPNARVGNDELFFAAVYQTNSGGPAAVTKPRQKSLIAGLNLKAGRRAVELSDHRTAFKLFKHGISFLEDDHWTSSYELTIDLFNAAAEAGCVINDRDAVKNISDEVVTQARCFDDKLNCLYSVTKVLRNTEKLVESMDATFQLLLQVEEEMPRPLGDAKLNNDIQEMNAVLQNSSDETILDMNKATNDRIGVILKLYSNLIDTLQFHNPSLKAAVSLRMVQLTLKSGLSATSPFAFACYGELLVTTGKISEGCRLGRLALKLLRKTDLATHNSSVIFYVYQTILWTLEPLKSIVDAHIVGQKLGQNSGDFVYANLNWHLSFVISYTAGYELNAVSDNVTAYIEEVQGSDNRLFAGFMIFSVLLHSQLAALKDGPRVLDLDHIAGIPTERGVLAKAPPNPMIQLQTHIHRLARAFLFRQVDEISVNANVSDMIARHKHPLSPLYLFGIYVEGLASFYLAREETNERLKWITKGESALAMMRGLSEHSSWNWKNKMLLLEAERIHTLNDEGAAHFYDKAIQSTREQKFVHEEAMASELAGMFYRGTGYHQKSFQLLLHSVLCYKKWGALAVARRVEAYIESKYGSAVTLLGVNDDALEHILQTNESLSNKRQTIG